MDQNLLPQMELKSAEGEAPAAKPIIWEPQRVAALAVNTAVTFQTRERGDYWRVGVMDSAPAAGNITRALVGQGVSVWNTACVQLGWGGCITIPVAENSITILNTGTTPLDVIVIMIGGFEDDYTIGGNLI